MYTDVGHLCTSSVCICGSLPTGRYEDSSLDLDEEALANAMEVAPGKTKTEEETDGPEGNER
jgi:hypothetical protein